MSNFDWYYVSKNYDNMIKRRDGEKGLLSPKSFKKGIKTFFRFFFLAKKETKAYWNDFKTVSCSEEFEWYIVSKKK